MINRDEAYAVVVKYGEELKALMGNEYNVTHDEQYGFDVFNADEQVNLRVQTNVVHYHDGTVGTSYEIKMEYRDWHNNTAYAHVHWPEYGFLLDFVPYDYKRNAPGFTVEQALFLCKAQAER